MGSPPCSGGLLLALRGVHWPTGRWRSMEVIGVAAGVFVVSMLSFWVSTAHRNAHTDSMSVFSTIAATTRSSIG